MKFDEKKARSKPNPEAPPRHATVKNLHESKRLNFYPACPHVPQRRREPGAPLAEAAATKAQIEKTTEARAVAEGTAIQAKGEKKSALSAGSTGLQKSFDDLDDFLLLTPRQLSGGVKRLLQAALRDGGLLRGDTEQLVHADA